MYFANPLKEYSVSLPFIEFSITHSDHFLLVYPMEWRQEPINPPSVNETNDTELNGKARVSGVV